MIEINTLLMPAPNRSTVFEGIVRVVAVSETGVTALMCLDVSPLKAPFNLPTVDLVTGIQASGDIVIVNTFDTGIPGSVSQLSEKHKEKLGKTVEIMSTLIGDPNVILDPELRANEFERVAKKFNINVRTIRRNFYRYLWGGQTALAMVDGAAKTNTRKQQTNGSKRRGPKINIGTVSQVILPEVRELLEMGAREFFLSGKFTLFESFVLTLKKYFSDGKKVASTYGGKVTLSEILLPEEKLPTYRQFRYVCDKLVASEGGREVKPKQPRQQKSKEAQRGRARHGVHGPGFRFEIDATKIQVQLVSRYGRSRLVSEATLYIIIDVWSGAIVGYAISLENASWALASKALFNCFTDKGDVFKRIGLDYESEDWPARHLPSRLAADRGEMVSNKAGVVAEIGIKVEIMPSMRPDRKGKVESTFRSIKYDNSHYYIPGKHAKGPVRRESNGKDAAALTLNELEVIIVEIILDLNNEPVPLDSIPAEIIKEGYTAITHIGMYKWGLENRPGFTRTLPKKEVFNNLLLKGDGSVTAKGIHFKSQYFTSPVLLSNRYQARAVANGAFVIELRYDEHFGDEVWFYDQTEGDWLPAFNNDPQVQRLKASFYEIEAFRKEGEKLRIEAKSENTHKKDEKAKRINVMTHAAEKEAKLAKAGKTKTQQTENVKMNKKIEVDINRLLQSQETLASYTSGINVARQSANRTQEGIDTEVQTKSIASKSKNLWEGI